MEKQRYPDKMYIPVPVIAKKASLIVGITCLFSLMLTITTGFSMIHPLFAVLALIASTGFYSMGYLIDQDYPPI